MIAHDRSLGEYLIRHISHCIDHPARIHANVNDQFLGSGDLQRSELVTEIIGGVLPEGENMNVANIITGHSTLHRRHGDL